MYVLATLIFVVWIKFSATQNAGCDFSQNVALTNTYYVYSPNYPEPYPAEIQCRWIAKCPSGYNCRLRCTDINIPQSASCTNDRLLISKTGDPLLSAPETYCGRGNLTAVSAAQTLSVGLITTSSSTGGRFRCELTAQLASNTGSCSCGYKKTNRIVGGQETGEKEFPYMAGVMYRNLDEIKCGGVIINNRNIVTAAHCTKDQPASNLAVVVGVHDVENTQSTTRQDFLVYAITIHPQFTDSNYDYDIAILTINGVIRFSDAVAPVCLPFKFVNTNFTDRTVTVLGWGTQYFGGPKSNVLQKTEVNVISSSSCRSRVANLSPRQFCTFKEGRDACQDDSGGPLLYRDPTTGLEFTLGIVSNGISCAIRLPAINTMVYNSNILQWIIASTPGANYCIK